MINTSRFISISSPRQLALAGLSFLLMLFCLSCSGINSQVADVGGEHFPGETAAAEISCACLCDGSPDENAWLAVAQSEVLDRESTLTVFLNYLEDMGASSAGVLPPTAADVEIETQAETGARYHFPLVMNAKVDHFISYYSTVNNRFMHRSLARSHRYLDMMRRVLRAHEIPEELAYMVLIESGFTTHAYSHARACGPWQFISSTGRRYGLKINSWVDERRDPVKATYAAAQYLSDLYEMFGSWYLAAAAYNAGEGKIQRAMRRHKTDDFWQMANFRYLKRETREYIPRLLAAIVIAKEPEKYGFVDIEYEAPFTYDLVKVADATDLDALAWASGVRIEDIRKLNPELNCWCTPPKVKDYKVKVPLGTGERCQKALADLPPAKRVTFRKHRIRPGDTLSTIAQCYHTGVRQIKDLNGLRGSRIRAGRDLLIPVRVSGRGAVVFDQQIYRPGSFSQLNYTQQKHSRKVVSSYRVRKGDSLWKIARSHNLRVADIQGWNNLGRSTAIKPGQLLKLKDQTRVVKKRSRITKKSTSSIQKKKRVVTLRKGDNLWRISRRYQVSVADLERWNNIHSKTILQPGQRLILFR